MNKCGGCGLELINCQCPAGLGGGGDGEGGASSDSEDDHSFDAKVDEIADKILAQYLELQGQDPSQVGPLIEKLRGIFNDDRANFLLERLESGTFVEADKAQFKEIFKNLKPNRAMLKALSDELNLEAFPNPANALNLKLSAAIQALEGFPDYPILMNQSFSEALEAYQAYHSQLTPEQQEALSPKFWETIKEMGTPIIEEVNAGTMRVHFLFDESQYDARENNLYVTGDFHGILSTRESQQMHPLGTTGIMHRSDEMAKDSVVTYQFAQVPKDYANKERAYFSGPSEARPEQFYPYEKGAEGSFSPPQTADGKSPLEGTELPDPNAKHQSVHALPDDKKHLGIQFLQPGIAMFSANPENDLSQLHLRQVALPHMLGPEGEPDQPLEHLAHRATYLCGPDDVLREDREIGEDYVPKLFSKEQENTRAVSVFEPKSGDTDHLLIVNDGLAYIETNMTERVDELISEGKLPENTAIVFVTPLPGLVRKYAAEDPEHFHTGMDKRAVEFGDKIKEHSRFLREELLPQLGLSHIPPENRTIIGSSMSGTASLYMALNHPNEFPNAVVQSPSYSNRYVLTPALTARIDEKKEGQVEDLSERVKLSCGLYDDLEHAQNLNLAHTEELAHALGGDEPLPIQTGNFGHLTHSWSEELRGTLPEFHEEKAEETHRLQL